MANERALRFKYPTDWRRYDLGPEISSGLKAKVYRAMYSYEKKTVAIKTIKFDHGSNSAMAVLLSRSNSISSELSHPNILSSHCTFIAKDLHIWVVMPLLETGSIKSIMACDHDSGLSEENVAVILREILEALSYLHQRHLFHGGIKTGNILVSSDRILIADYGCSESVYAPDSALSMDCTPYWTAPRSEKSSDTYIKSSDIWSVGVVALEMCYGRPPIRKARLVPYSLLESIKTRFGYWNYKKTRSRVHDFSQEFIDMVSLCLQNDPSRRPSAKNLLKHPFFLKYSTSSTSDIIRELEGRTHPGVEEMVNKENDDKIQDRLFKRKTEEPTSFITAWEFSEKKFLLKPIFTHQKKQKVERTEEHIRSQRFFTEDCNFSSPYKIFCCGSFIYHLIARKFDSASILLPKLLDGPVNLFTSMCVVQEMKEMGYSRAVKEALKLRLVNCGHKASKTGAKCVVDYVGVKNAEKFFVATMNERLWETLGKLPYTPVIHANDDAVLLRPPSESWIKNLRNQPKRDDDKWRTYQRSRMKTRKKERKRLDGVLDMGVAFA
ncbi:rRNA-processing protein Fcf1/Utp [Trema orientale]|uniref:rRNA-processing protein Fcf1/Utp n=1 Tax=Trema orientale TaxID=63057 RepID=A0A2P5FYR9_TREOI|nr:rRNA-processing protein Fcf1/Utp [Trema orientale]